MPRKDTSSAPNVTAADAEYMRRALQLARCGRLTAAPNPMVGAVVVADGRIIGEGYHIRPGEGHAEVNALASVSEADRALLPRSTMYVSLEPCAHYGRTPPCAELLVRSRIRRVVVGCIDPFAKVSGRGVAILREAGIDVTVGVLEDECLRLNRRFITFHSKRRPYILLKWARSADGFIDRERTGGTAARLSTPATQAEVHRLRSETEAILVGRRTWQLDSPRLDVRRWFGRAPLRCVLGRSTDIALPDDVLRADTIDSLLRELHARGVQSLLVEGGRHTLQSFIDLGLWDEAREEVAALRLGSGVPAPRMPRPADREETVWGVTVRQWEQ
ncbi:MAG: bifunctional diaminohydroxyphosphoribosylaminopyrimidine deaminase/5-amino-6-(5-phosphoribosylamino)uracil reductase RibD [Bacteroidaceae bacterium]|nr:bifunctional diaminohydroxyphosphoribosylaminopyrimidine deaminase/5-amino-6-(5-phosphoribosylamino)uracil reductase RibD [Bacteroidaceae bacterium]